MVGDQQRVIDWPLLNHYSSIEAALGKVRCGPRINEVGTHNHVRGAWSDGDSCLLRVSWRPACTRRNTPRGDEASALPR